MGLNSKESVIVKEERVRETCEGSGVMWSLSNKEATLYNLKSSKPEQDDKPLKTKSGLDVFEAIHKQQPGDVKNFGGADTKQQFSCGNPFATSDLAGSTKQWLNSIPSSIPAQLTIFYGGKVSVFDNITPEKAQAIIFLAGSGCIPSNMARPKLSAADRMMVNQNMPPGSDPLSPISVSSHPIDQSGVPINVKASKTTVVNKVELPCMILSLGSMISSAVPQARRASLARFLEKRRERVMNAAPYKLCKKESDCATPDSDSCSFSVTFPDGTNSAASTNKDHY